MDPTRPLDAETVEIAQRALHEAISDLLEAAVDMTADADAVEALPELRGLCADVAALTVAIGIFRTRVQR